MTPLFKAGEHVRTNQCVHRLHTGRTGTIHRIFDTGDLFDVLFAGERAPLRMYRDQLEALPWQDIEYATLHREQSENERSRLHNDA